MSKRAGAWFAVVLLCLAVPASTLAADEEPRTETEESALPPALSSFLRARLLEVSGRFSEAADAYAEALRQDPEQIEIRVSYAALMLKFGLPETAYSLLKDRELSDWFGQRTLALALTQLATEKEELLSEAEQVLGDALDSRPDDPNLLLAHAQVLHKLGRLVQAEEIVADLRASRGDNQQIVAFHATILHDMGRLREAEPLYRLCSASRSRGSLCRERLVELLVDRGQLAEAGEAMLGWLADDDLDELLRAAALLSDGGRSEQALAVVCRVLAVVPGSVRARTLEALIVSSLGRYDEAASKLRALLREDRDNLDLILPLAWAEARLAHTDQARRLIEQAWDLVKTDPAAPLAVRTCLTAARVELSLGKPLVAREWLERVVDPELGGIELVRLLAASYRQAKQWQEGMAGMLRLQPRLSGQARSEATANEAEFRLRLGSAKGYQRLRPLLQSADPTEVLLGLQVLQTLERWQDVEQEAAAASKRMPQLRDLRYLRAAALERLGRIDEAGTIFRALIEEDPEDTATANYLGYMWADNNVNLHEALELVARAVEAEPDNAAYIDSLGWVHYRLGNIEEAERWLRRATALGATGDGTVIAHLGEVLLELGQTEEARLLLQQALDLGCEDTDHVRGLLDGLDD